MSFALPAAPPAPFFVGRQPELARWLEVLADPRGQAVLVVGPSGMGKTLLLSRMADLARHHSSLRCGCVREEITPTDSPASILELLLDHAYDAAHLTPGSFSATPQRLEQWRAFLNVLNIGDLVMSLRRDPKRSTRDQFLERLGQISSALPAHGRAVFVIDPEKTLHPGSDADWALVTSRLPDKIKLLFAQRSEDCLAHSSEFQGLIAQGRAVRIPDATLDVLDDSAIHEMVEDAASRTHRSPTELRSAIARYHNHPYAVRAALDLIAAGTDPASLPADPTTTQIAAKQWEKVSTGGATARNGEHAIRLFEAYTVLEVPVPAPVVEAVSELSAVQIKSLLADPYLAPLLRHDSGRTRIYHSILSDHILSQLTNDQSLPYHRRAIAYYRSRLEHAKTTQTAPDELAALRLPEHVLAIEGPIGFVRTYSNEVFPVLFDLGALEMSLGLCRRALNYAGSDPLAQGAVVGNLGIIQKACGDLDSAEKNLHAAMSLLRGTRVPEPMVAVYANLGGLYRTRGLPDRAEPLLRSALSLAEELGREHDTAQVLGELGILLQGNGRLDEGEACVGRAVALNKKLGRPGGLASNYSTLGLILNSRGNLDLAEDYLRKALAINEKLGRLHSIASNYANLALVFSARGHLDRAEAFHRKALAINEGIGRLEAMAKNYANLGNLAVRRRDLPAARTLWTRSRDLFTQVGVSDKMKQMQAALDSLPPDPPTKV